MTVSNDITYTTVETPSGFIRGVFAPAGEGNREVATFKGIPFAQAPVGELRFAAPVPVEPWNGVHDALEFGPTAQRGDPGVTFIPEPSVPGDATLNLNVVTPAPGDSEAKLPVLVWIHGGGYFAGSPASPWYSSPGFARDGVVTVVISYRLGFDGFGHIPGAPSNRGVRDWLCALEWVQTHIESFGGDPKNVTLAGQSAGGGAVLTLLGMKAAQGLFHKVIALSSAVGVVSATRAEQLSKKIAAKAVVPCTRAGFASVDEKTLLDIQKEVTDISSGKAMTEMLDTGLPLGPTIDGELITRPTLDAFASGVGSDIPLLINAADDEFGMAFADAGKLIKYLPTSLLLSRMGSTKAARKAWLADNEDVKAKGNAALMGRFISDRLFRVGLIEVAESRTNAQTWVSRFSWRTPKFDAAVHCLDVPFFFDCLDSVAIEALAGPNPPQSLADAVHGTAVNFIKNTEPGWAPYTEQDKATMIFDTPEPRLIQDGYKSVAALRPAAASA